jgi:hypothetical protein
MELADNLTDAHPPDLPLKNRMNRFVTLDRAVGPPERAEALARSHASLDRPMILLQHIIKVLHRPQSTSTLHRSFCLQRLNDWRVGRIPVHIDYPRRGMVRQTQCLLKEPLGCCCIAPGRRAENRCCRRPRPPPDTNTSICPLRGCKFHQRASFC